MLGLKRTAGQAIIIGEYTLRFITVSQSLISGTIIDGNDNVRPWNWVNPTRESVLQVGRATVYFGGVTRDFSIQVGIKAPTEIAIVREERLEKPTAT